MKAKTITAEDFSPYRIAENCDISQKRVAIRQFFRHIPKLRTIIPKLRTINPILGLRIANIV